MPTIGNKPLKNLFKRFKGYRVLRPAATTMDVAAAICAFLFAYSIAYGYPRFIHVPGLGLKALIFAFLFLFSFYLFSLQRSSWRYVSLPDFVQITKVSVVSVLLYTVALFVVTRGSNVPRSVPILTTLFLIGGLTAPRLAYRLLMEQSPPLFEPRHDPPGKVHYALLCGVSDRAESLIRALNGSSGRKMKVAGILDDSRINHGRNVRGVRVLGSLAQLERVLARLEKRGIAVKELIVTETTPGRRRLVEIVEAGTAQGLTVSRIPDPTDKTQITNGTLLEPKPIELSDLLERPEIKGDVEEISRLIEGRDILITGAGGSIGSELSRQIAEFAPHRLVITDNSEHHLYKLDTALRDSGIGFELVSRILDVRDAARVGTVFAEFKPDVVFHAAALKHVPMIEENPIEGLKTNVLGTRNAADAALANDVATFVMVSTDKAVNPINIMGCSKRAAESYCQVLDITSKTTRFKTVRFGNVLGSNGSVVPRFQEQIASGGPVTVTHRDIVRFFMTIPEAVRLVLHACAHAEDPDSERGRIMVLDMGKPVKITDLAERMIQLAGFRPGVDIDIVFTGLRRGEKLYEELFDPSELQRTPVEESYVIASPRLVDKIFIERTFSSLEAAVKSENVARSIEILSLIVPEYRPLGEPRDGGVAAPGTSAGGQADHAIVEPLQMPLKRRPDETIHGKDI